MSSAKLKTEMISLLLDKLISPNYRGQNGAVRIFRHVEKGANVVRNVLLLWGFYVYFLSLAVCQSPYFGHLMHKYPKGQRSDYKLTRKSCSSNVFRESNLPLGNHFVLSDYLLQIVIRPCQVQNGRWKLFLLQNKCSRSVRKVLFNKP